jgi:hypothetical protein
LVIVNPRYLADVTSSRVWPYDTIIYLTIANEDDASTLQEDLNKLGQWENEWCIKFHPDKCNVQACSLILIDGIFRFLLRNPKVLFALAVILFMCWSHCNLLVIVNPRYLADVTS